MRELLLGVEEFFFGPQRSQEEPGGSAIAGVDVWVENQIDLRKRS